MKKTWWQRGRAKDFGDDTFSNERSRAWVRSKCQAEYRLEDWHLTREEFFNFWSTPDLWAQRGRARDDLVLTRIDWEKPWSKENCCIMSRHKQILIKSAVRWGYDLEPLYKDCIIYPHV